MFNSLRYTKKLEAVGFTREQAETHVLMLTELMQSDLATKRNLEDSTRELRAEIDSVKIEMREFRTEFNTRFLIMEQRLTIRLGTIATIAVGTAVAIAKLVA